MNEEIKNIIMEHAMGMLDEQTRSLICEKLKTVFTGLSVIDMTTSTDIDALTLVYVIDEENTQQMLRIQTANGLLDINNIIVELD